MGAGTDTGTKGLASNYLAKALEKLKDSQDVIDEHTSARDTFKALLSNGKPNLLGGTGINKGGVDTGIGTVLDKAPFATQEEADQDLLQQQMDLINKQASARQLGDTQNVTTNTLGTGLVKQNVEEVPGRASIFKMGQDVLNSATKINNVSNPLDLFKAKEDYKMSLKNTSLNPQQVMNYGETILGNSSALSLIPSQYKGEAIRYARSKDPNWKYTSAWQMSPVGTETAKLVGNDETIHNNLYGSGTKEGVYDISDRLSMNEIWGATFGNGSGAIVKNAASLFKNPDQLNLNSNLSQMHNVILNMLSGAAVSEQEANRIANQILPLIGDDKNTWTTRIQMTLDQVNNIARQAMMTRGEFVNQTSGTKETGTNKTTTTVPETKPETKSKLTAEQKQKLINDLKKVR